MLVYLYICVRMTTLDGSVQVLYVSVKLMGANIDHLSLCKIAA